MIKLRLDELNDPAACLDRAGPGGEDVLHPLHVRPIGQEEEVVVASPEDVDRRSVCTSGLAPTVRQDGEGGKPLRDRPRDRIDIAVDNAPETPHASPAICAVDVSVHQVGTIRPDATGQSKPAWQRCRAPRAVASISDGVAPRLRLLCARSLSGHCEAPPKLVQLVLRVDDFDGKEEHGDHIEDEAKNRVRLAGEAS